jgi:hypothetical protein
MTHRTGLVDMKKSLVLLNIKICSDIPMLQSSVLQRFTNGVSIKGDMEFIK